jgi:hypothetical protein
MIQPGMMFGGEGPIMQGTWYNPKNGDAFTVRDSFFEDNQYVVTTTDGRYFRYDQLQNYIQSDMKLEDLKKMKQNTPAVHEDPIPAEVSNLIATNSNDNNDFGLLPDEMDLIKGPAQTKSLGNIHATSTVVQQSYPRQFNVLDDPAVPVNMNTAIIEKALKNAPKPDFSINIKWNDYPEKQIEMLKDIMDIPTSEIVDWYLENIQLNDFVLAFKTAIEKCLVTGSVIESTEVIPDTEVENGVIDMPLCIDEYNIPDTSVKSTKKETKHKATAKNATKKTVKKQSIKTN